MSSPRHPTHRPTQSRTADARVAGPASVQLAPGRRLEAQATRLVMAVLLLCFVGLAWFYSPRLVNCLWSDDEFTGWVAPIAERIAAGQRIYRDFTLPIPPASFLLLAGVQRLLGRAELLDEIRLVALCQLGMVIAAYWLVRPFCARRTAVLTAACTAPVLTATPKEIAYDQTAQLVAWVSLALLARGLVEAPGRARSRWLAGAGTLAGLTVAFKSSTGVGAIGACLVALGLLAAIDWRRRGLDALRPLVRDAGAIGVGLALGAAATVGLVVAAGGSLLEFWRVVFVSGPALKGGTTRALGNLLSYVAFQYPVYVSLLVAVLVAHVLARHGGGYRIFQALPAAVGRLPQAYPPTGLGFALLATTLIVAVYGTGMMLLATGVEVLPLSLRALAELGQHPRMLPLFALVVLLVANLRAARSSTDRRAVFAAIAFAGGLQSLAHSLSTPETRLFYYNNPVIPLAIGAALHALARARAHWLEWLVTALFLVGLFDAKFQRYLDAKHPVDDPGFWRGLRVSDNGRILLGAAHRIRELAGPDGTVLMLPEDPGFEALIDRPRPPLFGAILFVDQYPAHALRRDRATLLGSPPKVLVLHPSAEKQWKDWYAIWARHSPAQRLHEDFLRQRFASSYELDSSYPTWFFNSTSILDVYVRTP